jgi:hypothetical protein
MLHLDQGSDNALLGILGQIDKFLMESLFSAESGGLSCAQLGTR